MRYLTAALVGGLVAAPLIAAGPASALPASYCDGVDCVPFVDRNVVAGAYCNPATRYPYGVDASSSRTYVCTLTNKWVLTRPLVGVRPASAPCDGSKGSAQSPDGMPMTCKGVAWAPDYTDIFTPQTAPATSS